MVLFVRWRLHGCDVCMLGMCWSVGRVSGVGLYAMVCIFAMDVASRDIVVTYVGGWLVIRWASEYGPCMCGDGR